MEYVGNSHVRNVLLPGVVIVLDVCTAVIALRTAPVTPGYLDSYLVCPLVMYVPVPVCCIA